MGKIVQRMGFAVVGGLASAAARRFADRGVRRSWQAVAGQRPPRKEPLKEGWPAGRAAAWAALSAGAIAGASVLGREGAARLWRDIFGRRPPNA
jgi:hypothetical protein